MARLWVLTANGSKATIFTANSPTAPLAELESFENPEARMKQMDLISDRPGRAFDSMGAGRHAMASEVEPKEQDQIRFAKMLADRLEQGRVAGAFEQLVLVASPALLGHLREKLPEPLRLLVSFELDKDYTALTPAELRARLPSRL